MSKLKIERAFELMRVGLSKVAITRALEMTTADWKAFLRRNGTDFAKTFTAIKLREIERKKNEEMRKTLAKGLRPVDFIKLTERGLKQIKKTLLDQHTDIISGNCRFDFEESMEILPYAMRANNGNAYITIRAKEHSGYRGDSTVVVKFPNMFIYLFGHAEIVDTVPTCVAIAAARTKLQGTIDNVAFSTDIVRMLSGVGVDEIVIPTSKHEVFASTHVAIEAANKAFGMNINTEHFINDYLNSSNVTVRPNPDGPIGGVFNIRTRIQK